MSGFNTSTRAADVSMKLRSQNLRNARDQTKRLEHDNRKMEERLRELKTAMTREKEERERQGGGFWGRGQVQTGSLTKYADEVLTAKTQKPPREGKKKKIKVLQDEPIDVPKRSAQPGTMKYIAQRKLPAGPGPVPRDKQKGPKCGQCEDRVATLSCVQCSEIYCPGCFAAFHVKGALKAHRSVPISASGPRVCMSPHPSLDPQQSPRDSQASGSIVSQSHSYGEGSGASSARQPPSPSSQADHGSAGVGGGSLLTGDYDETQSAASFQAALMAWRGEGGSPGGGNSDSTGGLPSGARIQPKRVVASPVKSPVIAVDESTGTTQEARVPEIKFTSTLSYAERLMLKGHRRTELAETSTPRLDPSPPRSGAGDQSQQMLSSRSSRHHEGQGDTWDGGRQSASSRSSSFFTERNDGLRHGSSRLEDIGNDDLSGDENDRVDFQSLFAAVTSTESPEQNSARGSHSSVSSVSITEVISTIPSEAPKFKTSTTYVVQEAKPMEAWKIQQNQSSSATFVKDRVTSDLYNKQQSSSSSSSRPIKDRHGITDLYPRSADATPDLYGAISDHLSSSVSHGAETSLRTAQGKDKRTRNDQQTDQEKQQSDDVGLTPRLSKSRLSSSKAQRSSVVESGSAQERTETADKTDVNQTASSRPKSSLSSRPKSSAQKSRPNSRAQSRAFSRMKIEGLLTKAPSSALSQVAQLAQSLEHTYTYQSPLEEFFLAGVEAEKPKDIPEEGRVLTPSKGRKSNTGAGDRPTSRAGSAATNREEKYKISYKLYKMAPRSWRPDSSLGEAVPLDEVKVEAPNEEMTLTYSYSGQLGGQATEWTPTSSLDSSSQNTDSLVFGDEMFTEDAAAVISARSRPNSSLMTSQRNSSALSKDRRKDYTSSRQQGEKYGDDDSGDITPTPSRAAARRTSANRRSFTPTTSSLDNTDSVYNSLESGAKTPTPGDGSHHTAGTGGGVSIARSGSEVRRSANLRRALSGVAKVEGGSASSSPLPPASLTPTPPSRQKLSSRELSKPSTPSHPSNTEAKQERSASAASTRSAQLSRRGLRSSDDPSTETPILPSKPSQRLASSQGGSRREPTTNLEKSTTRNSIYSDDGDLEHGQGQPKVTGMSRQGTGASRVGFVSRHASDVSARSQTHRPASTTGKTALTERNKTQTQQWRPNSSTGGADTTTRSSMGDTHTHLHKDTVVSDMLQSRVQTDGWLEDGPEGLSDEDDVGMSHNYDDGDDLNLMQLMRGNKGGNKSLRSSQHWETEVRPFSGSSARAGNSASVLSARRREGAGSSSSRPVSSMSQASGRESRAIVMDGEDLSVYDHIGSAPLEDTQDMEDRDALEKLEWELASDTGRLTADGQISRMSMYDEEATSPPTSSAKLRQSSEHEYDVTAKLLADEQHAHEEEGDEFDMRRSVTLDEDEVKALR